ncbi:FtsX-like permease family protein [Longispora albida]|uniref:FtsX-like permease family protein n=1 Tax=Longispora albida TaxID=203523 RepID=UPI00036CB43B|nr:FtsX-like permease family protein [Longispora albida]
MGGSVTLQGIRFRRGLSLVVLILAAFAAASAVLVPAYTRAAQASVLADGLNAAEPWQLQVRMTADGPAPLAQVKSAADEAIRGRKTGRHVGPGVGTAGEKVEAGPLGNAGLLVYREGICEHLRMTSGTCAGPGQVMLTAGTAKLLGAEVGQPVQLNRATVNGNADKSSLTLSGIYEPKDSRSQYWGRVVLFRGSSPDSDQADGPLFAGEEKSIFGVTRTSAIDYPVRPGSFALSDVEPVGAEFVVMAWKPGLNVQSSLGGLLKDIKAEQEALSNGVPLVALPLLLLCLFVLFLAVASVTEERGPEIALAKLWGFGAGRTVRFGLGEALVLIAVATPVGLLLGLGITELAGQVLFYPGTHVEPRWELLVAALGAVAGAALTAGLAARATLRRPALSLLRRVPARGRLKAAVGEGAVLALAGAALFQVLVAGDRNSSLGLLAAPLLSLVAGLLAARGLALWSKRRAGRAAKSGKVPAMLAHAQLGRRQSTVRLAMVLTAALALLGFSTAIWGVADINRTRTAQAKVGAAKVYQVSAASPQSLLDGVAKADPGGKNAMAAMRAVQSYGGESISIIGVDSARLAPIVSWPDVTEAEAAQIAGKLAVDQSAALTIQGPEVSVAASVESVTSERPLQLAAWVTSLNAAPRQVQLGELKPGAGTYSAKLTGCTTGCRLIGLVVQRHPSGSKGYAVTLTVTKIVSGGQQVPAKLDRKEMWTQGAEVSGNSLTVEPAAENKGLTFAVKSEGGNDLAIRYADLPARLPAALAGPVPDSNPDGQDFQIIAFGRGVQKFAVSDRVQIVPRGGEHGLITDLHGAAWSAAVETNPGNLGAITFEVWTGPGAPAGFDKTLAAAGLQVISVDSRAAYQDRLERAAPALSLALYMVAGGLSVLLAVGAVLLNAHVGVRSRLYELASLRVAGLRAGTLRGAVRREYATLLGVPLVVGGLTGVLSATLMVRAIPLVTTASDALKPVYRLSPAELGVAGTVTVLGFAAVVGVVLRLVGRAKADLLRSGVR